MIMFHPIPVSCFNLYGGRIETISITLHNLIENYFSVLRFKTKKIQLGNRDNSSLEIIPELIKYQITI